jgi:hypothetical protein
VKDHISPQNRKYVLFFALIIPFSLLFSFFTYLVAPSVVKFSLPVVTSVIKQSYPEVELTHIGYKDTGLRVIEFTMKIKKWIQGIDLPLIDNLSSTLLISMQFITAIIFYTLLFSWPFISIRKKILTAVISIPFLMLLILMDISFSIVAIIEVICKKSTTGYVLNESMLNNIVIFGGHFFNNGGRQFLGVFLFLISVISYRRFSLRNKDKKNTDTNILKKSKREMIK